MEPHAGGAIAWPDHRDLDGRRQCARRYGEPELADLERSAPLVEIRRRAVVRRGRATGNRGTRRVGNRCRGTGGTGGLGRVPGPRQLRRAELRRPIARIGRQVGVAGREGQHREGGKKLG